MEAVAVIVLTPGLRVTSGQTARFKSSGLTLPTGFPLTLSFTTEPLLKTFTGTVFSVRSANLRDVMYTVGRGLQLAL